MKKRIKIDDYQLLFVLGRGTYSTVYYSKHKQTEQIVAIKEMKEFEEVEGFVETSAREIKLLQKMNHINIIQLLGITASDDYCDGTGNVYLLFEYMPHDLQSLMYSSTIGPLLSHGQLKG